MICDNDIVSVVDEPSPSKIPLTAAGRSTLYSPNFVGSFTFLYLAILKSI